MGNGQNRRRRGGAHGRQGAHRGASANNDRRTTQLVPPTPANAAPEPPDASDAEDAGAILPTTDDADDVTPTAEAADEAPVVSEAAESGPAAAPEPLVSGETGAPAASASDASAPEPAAEPAAEPEQRAPRGRFERFYAPGQQPRAAIGNGRSAAPERNGKASGAHAVEGGASEDAGGGHVRHAPHAPHAPHSPRAPEPPHAPVPHAPVPHAPGAGEEDEETPFVAGPREDVRGAVGGLIDSLHDLFVRDRGLASQGGVSRCGICYLHYPLGELVYHEGEGFYVCQPCERALNGARVNMVRRQQRL